MKKKDFCRVEFVKDSEVTSCEKCKKSHQNTSCPPLVGDRNLRFRGGQLFERDSSVVSLPQNDCRKKKVAFTLAEVLITLGIIGVVAAMTIPNLIANTNGAKYRSQFKKTVSTLSQAGLMAQAQYDFDYAGTNLQCEEASETGATNHPETDMTICAILNGTLTGQTYFSEAGDTKENFGYNIVKSHTIRLKGGDGTPPSAYQAYVLADGSIVAFYFEAVGCELPIGTQLNNSALTTAPLKNCLGFIDVNGVSLPNKEVSCSDGTTTSLNPDKPCIVKNDANHMTDIFPIVFHDTTVEPVTNAAKYVLVSSK